MAIAAATIAGAASTQSSVSKMQWTVIALMLVLLMLEAVAQPDIATKFTTLKHILMPVKEAKAGK